MKTKKTKKAVTEVSNSCLFTANRARELADGLCVSSSPVVVKVDEILNQIREISQLGGSKYSFGYEKFSDNSKYRDFVVERLQALGFKVAVNGWWMDVRW